MSVYSNFVPSLNPDSEPVRGLYRIQRGKPILPGPGPSLGNVQDLTGLATGFEQGPYGQAQTVRLSLYKSRLGPVWDI